MNYSAFRKAKQESWACNYKRQGKSRKRLIKLSNMKYNIILYLILLLYKLVEKINKFQICRKNTNNKKGSSKY
jgi:hypothetical protein